jgi:hypothetical protein
MATWGPQKVTIREMSQLTAASAKAQERVYAMAKIEHLLGATDGLLKVSLPPRKRR